jgi:hypothetical protein
LKIKFIGAALWIGMACAKKKFNIRRRRGVWYGDFGGKNRELRCVQYRCVLLNDADPRVMGVSGEDNVMSGGKKQGSSDDSGEMFGGRTKEM